MDKFLTIIVPTYNMEKYLHKCLDSLIVSDENMQRLEVLVINDGSKDSSSQIAHEYETNYPQAFRVIDKDNGNYGSCINRGLKEATGKYVKVLDADDFFDNCVLDGFVHFLSDKNYDLIISNHCQVNMAGKIEREYNYDFPTNKPFSFQLFDKKSINHFYHQNVTYRLDLLQRIHYFQTEGISYTDNEWVFKPTMFVQTIAYYPHNLYLYLRGREGQTFDPVVLRKSYSQRFIVMKSMTDYYSDCYIQCVESNKCFVRNRLIVRLVELYYYYLCVDRSFDNNLKLRSFDEYLSKRALDIFEKMNTVKTNLGLYYIKQWRKSGYNGNTLAIQVLRLKEKLVRLVK